MISGFKRDVRETTLRGHVHRKRGGGLGPPLDFEIISRNGCFFNLEG